MGGATFTGGILVAGTLVGLAPVANPSLLRVWNVPRAEHIAIVTAHRTAWRMLNGGFALATIATTCGIVALAGVLDGDSTQADVVVACGIAYGVAGLLWCAVLAVRSETTPFLSELGPGATDSPAVRLLDTAVGGLFRFYVVITGAALTALGLTLLIGDGIAAVVAVITVVVGVGSLVWLAVAGDVIPAVLYLPTLLIGIALLAGWS